MWTHDNDTPTPTTENVVVQPSPVVAVDTPVRPKRKASNGNGGVRKVVARKTSKSRKGRKWSFKLVGIGRGTRLRSTMIPTVVVTVASDNTIKMQGKEMSLTAAAKIIALRKKKRWPSIQGPMYFAPIAGPHKGERLAQMVS